MSRAFRNAAPYLAGIIYKTAAMLGSFLLVLALSSRMTPHEFGVYSIGFSAATITAPIADFGQRTLIIRFWPVLAERYGPATAHFTVLRGFVLVAAGSLTVLAAFVSAGVLNLGLPGAGEPQDSMVWTGLLCIALAMSLFATHCLTAQNQLDWALLPSGIIWRAAVIILALRVDQMTGLEGLIAVSLTLGTMTGAQVVRLFGNAHRAGLSPMSFKRPPDGEVRAMRRAQWGFFGLTTAKAWLSHAATVVVGVILGPVAAGAFFAASRLANLILLPSIGTSITAGPLIARDWHASRIEGVRKLTTMTSLFITAITGAGFMFLAGFGRWALALFDPIYVDAWGALIILCLGQFLNAFCDPIKTVLALANQERGLLGITAAAGIVGLGLTAAGGHYGGLTGVAMGVLLSLILLNGWAVRLCKKQLDIFPLNRKYLRAPGRTLKDIAAARTRMRTDGEGKKHSPIQGRPD